MILRKIKIRSFCILKNNISISVSTEDRRKSVVEELKKLQGKEWKYTIEANNTDDNTNGNTKKSIYINAKIQSLGLSRVVSFTFHTPIQRFVVFRLLDMKDAGDGVNIKFISTTESTLQDLMEKVAKKYGIKKEEAIRRVTTFRSKENAGKSIPGKRSIFELSDRHKEVAVDKLQKMLKEPVRLSI